METQRMLDSQDYKTFFVHTGAMDEIEKMFDRLTGVGVEFGRDSEQYRRTSDSLHQCLKAILTRSGFGRRMQITADGPLSLLCNESDTFVFGMVFFRDRAYDETPERPQPGEWSLHS